MPLRILLVEDEGDLAAAIQTVLQRQGHVVDHAPMDWRAGPCSAASWLATTWRSSIGCCRI